MWKKIKKLFSKKLPTISFKLCEGNAIIDCDWGSLKKSNPVDIYNFINLYSQMIQIISSGGLTGPISSSIMLRGYRNKSVIDVEAAKKIIELISDGSVDFDNPVISPKETFSDK